MSKQKDLSQKILEDIPEVFADIVNVLLFEGKAVVKENELEDFESRSQYKFAGKYHEQERDVAKYWKKAGIRIACCGFENQTKPDKYMPLRVFGYDGGAYRGQLIKKEGEKHLPMFPVITLVLYFGYKERWNAPRTLLEALDVIPPELRGKLNDFKIDVYEIAFLPRETIDRFKSDFWFVADYFWQLKNNPDYIPSKKRIKYTHAVMQAMFAFTGDNRYEKGYNELTKERGEYTMCEVLDKIEERGRQEGLKKGRWEGLQEGRQEGLQEGRQEGRREARSEITCTYITKCEASGKTPETIVTELEEFFDYSAADAQAAYDEFKKSRLKE